MNLKSILSSRSFNKIIILIVSFIVMYFTLNFILSDLINVKNCDCIKH